MSSIHRDDLLPQAPSHSTLTKREFLKGAGMAVAALGFGELHAAADRPWDLIVVGGGNAGLPTALFAAQRGARVLIVEAAGALGGTLFLSSGQMAAAGTRLQKQRGIDDSPQQHYDDIMRISRNTADPVLLRLAVEHAAPMFDWLTDHGLVPLDGQPITGTTHEPYSRPRYAWAKEGGRAILQTLMTQLQPYIDSGQVGVLTATRVVELIQRADRSVTGVVTRTEAGQVARHDARNVALTCGGYTDNSEMYARYEQTPDYCRNTWPYSQGAGIELGLAAGGWVRGGQNHTPLFGAVLADDEIPTSIRAMVRHFPPNRPPWEIYVNAAGERFLCEDVPSHDAYEQGLARQPGERCWVVFDEAIYRAAPPLVRSSFNSPWTPDDTAEAFATGEPNFFRADSIEALARTAGIDPAGLAATVKTYNAAQAGSRSDPFGRKYLPLPIAAAPFYAVRLAGWNLYSYAGIAVDGRLNVITADGKPIPNLYAAGETLGAGQIMGKAVCGGMSVTPALALGRLLGGQILQFKA
ncbi:MAG: FAD-dependent oxidoreductase [Sinobacteraceae bacterium]|nr:FAD-dependent oxidoreductase [Nevskiaceae bacterium]